MHKPEELAKLRHSVAHLAAQALLELYPTIQLTIGPATEDGFFYDFLPAANLKLEDLDQISLKMQDIVTRNLPITHELIDKGEARQLFKNNPFKLELINAIPDNKVGLSRQGNFFDLCKGGHLETTGKLAHFVLLGLSGSYWRADKNNQALQRITGTAFFTAQELEDFLKRREDAIAYDHRRLGKELDLFSFHEEGPGFPFYHPKGKRVLNILTALNRKKLENAGYQEVSTPIMLSEALWHKSGHYEHYKKNMYFCHADNESYAVKPMNCPGAILIYKEHPHSYKEFPKRFSEFGLVHRNELSGTMHGLLRARAFTQDDGHIFCTPEQIVDEVRKALELYFDIINLFHFKNISIHLATRPENSMGSDFLWDKATLALKEAIESTGKAYTIKEGDGAFYGPKFDFHIEDSMGRSWSVGTIQIDFFLPENFDLTYVTSQGIKSRPVMIHRAIYGSLERFFGILLEHYKGKLPFWLAPIQIKILTITDMQKEYARLIEDSLKKHGIRVITDMSSDPLQGQIKIAQQEKVPLMLVLGAKEMAQNTVSIRYPDGKQELHVTMDKFIEKLNMLNTPGN